MREDVDRGDVSRSSGRGDARENRAGPATPISISVVEHHALTALLDTTPERAGERRVDITWNPPRRLDLDPDPDPPPGDYSPGGIDPPLPDAA